MTVYTQSEVERQLARVLDQARLEGEVRIRSEGGEEFVVKPVPRGTSPLDVRGIDLNVTSAQIVEAVRESRER
jgi:hypothetical protein